MNQFSDFLNQASLISLPCSGYIFTWCNNHSTATRIYEHLDRGLANASWLHLYSNSSLVNLPIHGSDRGPICLSLAPNSLTMKRIFRFEAIYVASP